MSDREPNWPPAPLHVAVDVAALTVLAERLHALLWQRPYPPFEHAWSLPGRFSRPDETLGESPRLALQDKAGLDDVHIEQLATYDQPPRGDAPGRDPRGRVVSVAFLAVVCQGGGVELPPGVAWFRVDERPGPLAFDHDRILSDAVSRLRAKCRYTALAFELLPEPFTLPELQTVYEAVLDEALDPRNFRRDLLSAGVVEETGGTRSSGPGRPAKLYRRRSGAFAVDAEERRTAERIRRDRGADGPR